MYIWMNDFAAARKPVYRKQRPFLSGVW